MAEKQEGLCAAPRISAWISESLRAAVAHPAPFITVALVIAISCVAVLMTTGQTVASERRVLGTLDSMGTSVVVASDQGGEAGIRVVSVDSIASMDAADWAFGLGPASDVTNARGPMTVGGVAARSGYGDFSELGELTVGRWPREGEAVASHSAAQLLQFLDGIGGVAFADGGTIPVVGVFQSDGTVAAFDEVVIISGRAESETLRYIYARARSIAEVETLVEAIPLALTAYNPNAVIVESPGGLIAAREIIASNLGTTSRLLMVGTLAISLALVTVTMLVATSERKADFGRRRALGVTRASIVLMVVTQAIASAFGGVALGLATGTALVVVSGGDVPPFDFLAGLGILCVVATVIAALPPAILASRRDPVRILRVP